MDMMENQENWCQNEKKKDKILLKVGVASFTYCRDVCVYGIAHLNHWLL